MPYERCAGCHKIITAVRLNGELLGPYRFTRHGDPRIYCSRECRDGRRVEDYGKCRACGVSLQGKRKGSLYCSGTCRKRKIIAE